MRLHIILLSCIAALSYGCSHNTTASRPPGQGSSDPSQFDVAKEPAINANTHYAAGQLAESSEKFDHAIQQYQLALKSDPNHKPSMYRLGVLFTQAKRFDEAIEMWKQYIALTHGSASAYNNLALCFEAAGRMKDAELSYVFGIKQEPGNEACRVNFGLMLARTGREAEAITQLSVVLKPADVHYNLASVYEQIGKKAEARVEYQKALDLNPQLWDARTRLSKLD